MTKQEKIEYYRDRLCLESEVDVIEILDLKADEIVERFQDCIEDRLEYIESFFDEDDSINKMMHIIDIGE